MFRSSNVHEESQLDLDEMLGVLETDSQRKIYVASILDNEKEYLQVRSRRINDASSVVMAEVVWL